MTTARWYAKTMIKDNNYLTTFSKFSYWIWWIKVETARKIIKDIKLYNNDLYEKYFKDHENLEDEELIEILKDNYKWTLYAWALIYNIKQIWDLEWYSLENKPWIIITLYNMWNSDKKIPNDNPQIWGSVIDIEEWKQMLYWEIWYIIYYYLKYYF
jgi:hypothetical protein